MRSAKYIIAILILLTANQFLFAQNNKIKPALLSAIKEADLKKDLYEMADDHFRGREAGTLDELKVSMWLENKLRATGLKPAGDDGTYFQFFSMWRNRVAANSTIKIADHYFELWKDVFVAQTAPANVSAPIVYLGKGLKADLDKTDVKGKVVAILASPEGINLNVSLPERRYPVFVLRKFYADLTAKGAVAIIFIADDLAEKSFPHILPQVTRGLYDIEGGANEKVAAKVPVIWLHNNQLNFIQQQGLQLNATINIERFEYPSVNIVGLIDGTDAKLKSEYVLFSGHQDHDGIRQLYGTDSIYNGADDNASTSVALLAIARAFHQQPGKRSALFVWHGAEERGLLGSKWYASHPTVPKQSIVAVLNGDMIGRNHPDSASLLGSQSPHRNSTDLVNIALAANKKGPKFLLDTLWDKTNHVEYFYFRSDHLPYARLGIPSIFYTTVLHDEYHTPMDKANHINYPKLKRMTDWMYLTGWQVANITERPKTDSGFKLER